MDDVVIACRLVLVVWLGIPGLLKMRDWRGFRRSVYHYRLLPRRLAGLYSVVVPPTEIAAATALAGGVAIGAGALLASVLLASFAIAVTINLLRGRDMDCHCFGRIINARIGLHTLAVDCLLLAPGAFLTWRTLGGEGLLAPDWPFADGSPPGVGIAFGITYALALAMFYVPGIVRRRLAGLSVGGILVARLREN